MRHFLLRLFQLTTVLIIGTALWGGWYLAARGFTKKWRVYVVREIAKSGFDVSIKRLTLDPFRGLVAREVMVVDPARGRRVLAVIDEVALDINFNNFVQNQPFIESLQLHEAEIALPLGDKEDGALEIRKLNARVLLPPHQLYVSQARATIFGIEVALSGRLINPDALRSHADKPAKGSPGGLEWTRAVDQIMREIRFREAHPRLEITFLGDLAQPEQMTADLSFSAPRVDWRGGKWLAVAVKASYRDQVLDVKQATVKDALGVLDATGTWNVENGAAEGQLHCSLDVVRLATAFSLGKALEDVHFSGPPAVELSGTGNPKTGKFQLIGGATLPAFSIKNASFQSVTGGFSWDGERWYARDVVLKQTTGTLTLSARQLPGDFRAQLSGTINPNALRPLVSGPLGDAFREWDFLAPMQMQISVRGQKPTPEGALVDGTIQLGATKYRGAAMRAASAKVHLEDGVLTYNPLRIERAEGIAEGVFAYDFNQHALSLTHMKTSVMPAEVAVWIDQKLVPNIAPYRFHEPPQLTINGTVQPDGMNKTSLEILVSAPKGMDYTFMQKNLTLPSISGRLLFTDGKLEISALEAALFGGEITGGAAISLDPTQPGYHAHLEAQRVDFPSLTNLYFNYGNSQGKLDGTYDFTGLSDDPRTMSGHGWVKVMDGHVFGIPIFGPLSGLLNGVIPGFGYNIAREATASFTIKSGVVETRDLVIGGKGFAMLGSGTLDFLQDKIDLGVRINATGLTGKILSPLSRLFEYEGSGKLSKPTWRPKRLPSL